MHKYLLLLYIMSFIHQGKAQLMASAHNVNIGSVTVAEMNSLELPILNQSKEVLTFYSLNSSGQGMQSLPVEIQPYDLTYINLGNEGFSNSINQQLVFENSQGQKRVHLKGKLKRSSNDADCYDFSKPSLKAKQSNGGLKNDASLEVLRVYSEEDKHTLYASNPENVPSAHLIILLDASGSMGGHGKLEEMKEQLIALVDQLRPSDRLSVLRYSESSELVLDVTTCEDLTRIKEQINAIEAGGFTNGMEGITTSFDYLREHQKNGYSNHLIMLTDGDFNFGANQEEIRRYLLGQHRSLSYKFSIFTVQSEKANNKRMKELVNAGKGHYFNLEESIDVPFLNRILLKQLSS